MARYHPAKMISNNEAPILTADLSYENHGKCGCQTIILSNLPEDGTKSWEAERPNLQPTLPNLVECTDYSNVYKIVALSNTKFRALEIANVAVLQTSALLFSTGGFILKTGSEILANFTVIEIISGTLMLYRDCSQS